jgi:hypothetical protein
MKHNFTGIGISRVFAYRSLPALFAPADVMSVAAPRTFCLCQERKVAAAVKLWICRLPQGMLGNFAALVAFKSDH